MVQLPEGVLLIDKPVGITSFDVIRVLRKKYGVKKMGHAGTLDPMASGLMIVAYGKATPLLTTYTKLPKVYKATILLGEKTTTADVEGMVIEKENTTHISKEEIGHAVHTLVGTHNIPVPVYSAVKRGGEALYKKARRGESIVPPIRAMTVHRTTLKNVTRMGVYTLVTCELEVASGVYIRSLAEFLGTILHVPARLDALRRIRIGVYRVDDAVQL